jgi:Family of unknown function (DUF6328)
VPVPWGMKGRIFRELPLKSRLGTNLVAFGGSAPRTGILAGDAAQLAAPSNGGPTGRIGDPAKGQVRWRRYTIYRKRGFITSTLMELEPKLKLALDETSLLILGAQVLFGFLFQAVFQEGFGDLAAPEKTALCVGLIFILLTIVFLIAPSMHHQIVYRGESRYGALETATRFSRISLLPLTLGIGASMYLVFAHVFGPPAGVIAGVLLCAVALSLFYGLGMVVRLGRKAGAQMIREQQPTRLRIRIEQLLTEARVIIPGGQALLGFQFVAVLTRTFAALPYWAKVVHAAGLCSVGMAVILLMTPAAVHRIGYDGEDDETFFRIGSALVIMAAFPLALGIAADVFVVFFVVNENIYTAMTAAFLSLSIFIAFWFAYPVWLRAAGSALHE